MQTVKDAVNNVSETIQGKGHEASAEANKGEHFPHFTRRSAHTHANHFPLPLVTGVAKDSNASLGNRAEAAKDYVSDKIDQNKHEGKAELHEQKLKQ
ncbi:hypothetical protein IE81DRAFT_327205 [Ceraceosorus guamensis]|uniref:Uncharacterized protein n=1 Tax=Ceraceosorus guamensis TaxID=1522189 RepID=A0A316VMB5_9BASI|nr:hypothetical protein IE81DRAFT_327205 [Ceraceosorus guamensis]PWN38722.1 hypothetical protein IE81DRAFT_327205 [Ceraceosorus guamensis]